MLENDQLVAQFLRGLVRNRSGMSSSFESLTLALEDWFATPIAKLPDALRQRVVQEFFPMPWDTLSADQRRSVALQLDYQHDPAMENDRQDWWDFFQRMDAVKAQITDWNAVATPTAGELALKERRLVELQQDDHCCDNPAPGRARPP